LGGGLVGLCIVGAASADNGTGTGAAAQALYDEAKKLMASGRFGEACPKLQESQRLDPGGGTILLLARCHAREGRTATAWMEFQEAQRTAVRDNRKEREKIARDEGAALEAHLSKLVIVVPPSTVVPGLSVRRDGVEVGPSQWSLAVAVDPGRHEVIASAPERATWSTVVDVRGEGAAVTVKVEPLAVAKREPVAEGAKSIDGTVPVAPEAAPLDPAGPKSSDGTPLRIGGGVAAGTGVVLLGVGTVFGLKAKSSNDQSHEPGYCTGNACSAEGVDLRHDAASQARVATVLVGLGAAALAAGVTLWLTAPKNEAAAVGVNVGPGLVAVRGTW